MGSRKKHIPHPPHGSSRRQSVARGFYTPFARLDQHLTRTFENTPAKSVNRSTSPASELFKEDERTFRDAMADVTPLDHRREVRIPFVPLRRNAPRFHAEEELEVTRYLENLVKGNADFDLFYSDEYVDGAVRGLSPQLLKKLREGSFSYQDFVDLHGFNREQARKIVEGFVRRSFAGSRNCVLIVCGRGLNSQDREPILKQGLVDWLTHAPLRHFVLAFSSARSYDGGSGAFYVLLRRNKGKSRIVSPAV